MSFRVHLKNRGKLDISQLTVQPSK